jgi:hypothetical protein
MKATEPPEQVYMSKREYQQYTFPNIKVNLMTLIAATALDDQQMAANS